jgi:hypothetical protein
MGAHGLDLFGRASFATRRLPHHSSMSHTEIESTVRYQGIEVDDALAIAEQVDV